MRRLTRFLHCPAVRYLAITMPIVLALLAPRASSAADDAIRDGKEKDDDAPIVFESDSARRVRFDHAKAIRRLDYERDRDRLRALKSYHRALERAMKRATYKEKIEEARSIKEEMERIEPALKDVYLRVKAIKALGYPLGKHPPDAVEWKGHYYKVYKVRMSWKDAYDACEDLGGYLACIETPEELNFLLGFRESSNLWVGGTDEDREGRWMWVNGRRMRNIMRWHPGNPDNINKREHYLEMGSNERNRDLFNDVHSDYQFNKGFICEWEK
jgi:hypothetical protein